MNENDNIIDEATALKKVLLSELGDWIAPVVSLVSEPSVPWARFVSVKSAAKTAKTGEERMEAFDFSDLNPLTLLRMKHNLSQMSLSLKSGIPQTTLSTYENGRILPADAAEKLAPTLGVAADDLLFASGIDAIKRKAREEDPSAVLLAAQAAYDLAQDTSLRDDQKFIAAKLCSELLQTVDDALANDGAADPDLPASTKSAEQPVDSGRDDFGRPTDPNRDIRIARGR